MRDMATLIIDDEAPFIEYIDGRVLPAVSPKRKHGLLTARFFQLLERLSGAPGQVSLEWRCYLPSDPEKPTTLVPDVAYVSLDRMKSLSDDEIEEPPFAPDVVVEIQSPSGRAGAIAQKIERYLRHGSILVLDVDPKKRTIAAHATDGVRKFEENDTFNHPAVPWLQFEIAPLFANLEIVR